MPITRDRDRCPHCGFTGNPTDARFCIAPACGEKLFQVCPRCKTELPWNYERCHLCGADIESTQAELNRQIKEKEKQINKEKVLWLREMRDTLIELESDRLVLTRPWGVFDRNSAHSKLIEKHNPEGKKKRLAVYSRVGFAVMGIVFLLMTMLCAIPIYMSGPGDPFGGFGIMLIVIIIVFVPILLYLRGVETRNIKRPIALRKVEGKIEELRQELDRHT